MNTRRADSRWASAAGLLAGLCLAGHAAAVSQLDVGLGPDAVNGTYINAGSLSNTLAFTSVTLVADSTVRFVDNVSFENSVFFGPTLFDLFVQAPTTQFLGNVTLGQGTLRLTTSTIDLNGVISRSVTSAAPLFTTSAGSGGNVNILANGLLDQGLQLASSSLGATVTVNGGVRADAITYASQNALFVSSASVNMTGGSLESVQLAGSSTFDWRGGDLLGTAGGYELFSFAGGVINVHGSGFVLNGTPIAPAALYSLSNAAGQLSGVLADGRAFSVDYNAGGTLNLISAVPEPGTWALMLGGLGLLTSAARRRKA